jgi:hypothetical protein
MAYAGAHFVASTSRSGCDVDLVQVQSQLAEHPVDGWTIGASFGVAA